MPPSHDMMRVFNIGDVEEKSKRTKTIEKWERKNKFFGRAEWQTNFYFRRYLEARREKNRTILPHDATEFDFLHILFNYNWSVVTGRVWTSRQSMSPFASIVTSTIYTSHHPITFLAIKIILHKEGMLSVSLFESSRPLHLTVSLKCMTQRGRRI